MINKRHFRIYAEVMEQALFFKETLLQFEAKIEIVYTNSAILKHSDKSIISLIRNKKKFDLLVSEIKYEQEFPLVMVEFSTAATTDDHEMQRADALFWAYSYKIPYLKIAPTDKKSQTAYDNFGGGRLLSIHDQLIYMYKNEGVIYHINWKSMDSSAYTSNHSKFPSCPDALDELFHIMHNLVKISEISSTRKEFYSLLHQAQGNNIVLGKKLSEFKNDNDSLVRKFGTKSSRLEYDLEKKTMCIKVNRYGHAMDPERGMLAFWRLVLGDQWKITAEFQIERSNLYGRSSYRSLFDGLSKETLLNTKARNIYMNDIKMTMDQAIMLHSIATSSTTLQFEDTEFKKIKWINSESLSSYLSSGFQTSVYKMIMYYVDDIILTDSLRNTICRITWDKHIVKKHYLELSNALGEKLIPLPLKPLSKADLSEDIITWATKELLVSSGYEILAISYPGAQGDRCVLIGSGTKVLRKYIDIIAISPITGDILLIEAKKELKSSVSDCEKMKILVKNNTQDIIKLLNTLNIKNYSYNQITTVVAGIGGSNEPNLNVDHKISFIFNEELQKMEWESDLKGLLKNKGEISVKELLTVRS